MYQPDPELVRTVAARILRSELDEIRDLSGVDIREQCEDEASAVGAALTDPDDDREEVEDEFVEAVRDAIRAALDAAFPVATAAAPVLAPSRPVRLPSPAGAVDPAVHTVARVQAYLTGRGIKEVWAGSRTTIWGVPIAGDTGFEFEMPRGESEVDYQARVGFIAVVLADADDTGEAEILAAIAAA